MAASLTEISDSRWARVKLLAFDVDGTLTDGSLTFDAQARLYQTFHVRDGFAMVAARRFVQIAWISGRTSEVARRRFEELKLHHCLIPCADKAAAMRDLQTQLNVSRDECCFVGDDLPDLPAFSECGLNIAVADAVPEVLSRAHAVTHCAGGRGAAREVIEQVLRAQGHWNALLSSYTLEEMAHEGEASA